MKTLALIALTFASLSTFASEVIRLGHDDQLVRANVISATRGYVQRSAISEVTAVVEFANPCAASIVGSYKYVLNDEMDALDLLVVIAEDAPEVCTAEYAPVQKSIKIRILAGLGERVTVNGKLAKEIR